MSQPMRIIAHRGASYDAPENTLVAFREAWLQNADGIEGDYRYTADQSVVCIHDDDTLRTGGIGLVIAESTFAELSQLEVGGWKRAEYRGEPIPLLSQVLNLVPAGKWCVLELKTGPEIVELVVNELLTANIDLSRILIIAFDSNTIAEFKKAMPTIKAHWLTEYDQDDAGSWNPTAAEIASTIRKIGADGLGSQNNRHVLTLDFISQLRVRGVKEFHVWTVDDPVDAAYYRDLGAWGVTTNRPGWLRSELTSS